MKQTVRTRFAPSPTGFLHAGNVRAALFPWLVARQAKGVFILRIEDTDQAREVAGAVHIMRETLEWLGITWDEGIEAGGAHGPYIQSQRLDTYRTWAEQLIAAGRAYADPYTPEQLDELRSAAKTSRKPFLYRNHRPENPPVWDGTKPLRFRSDPKSYTWHDEIMGELSAGEEAIDDFILVKSDGYPTYNFAHIVDDAEMEITHVIRGSEYIASQPNYLNLYEALDLQVPVLAHMPHILNETGNRKLSKRDGAKSILQYREEGYTPEAMLNFLASLGWNDGTEKEIFSRQELIDKFSLDRVQRSGARFDERRLLWMNGAWIRQMPLDELLRRAKPYWPESAATYDETYLSQVLSILQERIKYLAELEDLSDYFFQEPEPQPSMLDDHKQLSKLDHAQCLEVLEAAYTALDRQSSWTADALQGALNELLEQTGQKPVVLFSFIRLAVSWAPSSPGLADTLHVLGRERSLSRIERAITSLQA